MQAIFFMPHIIPRAAITSNLISRNMHSARLLLPMVAVLAASSAAGAQETVVAIFAHPDDERIVAPLLARYAREGHGVYLVVATDGAKGVTPHAQIPAGDSLAAIRVQETHCATRALGIKPPIMLGHPDAGLASFNALGKLRTDLERVINELKPRAILTFGREGGTGHPDHRLVGDVVTEIVQALPAEIPLYYPGLPAERMVDAPAARPTVRTVAERYLNVQVPYSPEDFDKAVRSYICHASQYTEEQARANMRYVQHGFRGAVQLRAWNGGERRTALFE
jgi:LmbE family N-acetylglucosaminyl deacetylase